MFMFTHACIPKRDLSVYRRLHDVHALESGGASTCSSAGAVVMSAAPPIAPHGGGPAPGMQPMQPIQQQVSIEQFMGQNPNAMPAEALPVSLQQQQPPPQAHRYQPQTQQAAYGAPHAPMAAQQQFQPPH
jgi:hypothetical protein